MNVATILHDKGPEVVTLPVDASIREAAKTLAKFRVGAIVVVDDEGRIRGILSERDIVKDIAECGGECLDDPVSSRMTGDVMTCKKSDTVEYLMGQMTRHRFRHIPVVENNELVGIVSIGDVVKQRIAETEMETTAMRAYIATG